MHQPYWLTLSEASATMGVSKDTLKRALRAGKLPNARQRQDDTRTWEIPIGDLAAAGYRPKSADAALPSSSGKQNDPDDPALRELRERVEHLQHELAIARIQAEERAARIADLQMALSLLARSVAERSAS
jgi:predicted site-specific integrase-resolvase